jgi:hypothetical protein
MSSVFVLLRLFLSFFFPTSPSPYLPFVSERMRTNCTSTVPPSLDISSYTFNIQSYIIEYNVHLDLVETQIEKKMFLVPSQCPELRRERDRASVFPSLASGNLPLGFPMTSFVPNKLQSPEGFT